ncbi:MAG: response regulator [Candidatus Accumulibacter sp.]|uniref:response regulator n=1 Tax=Accumulibacter sp. TaxID=2053492 RepID=UPI002591232D|nr:response regulator [Accumulibacter sp.]MBK8114988.1 response regulator [Accumulibacter sp.]
MSKPRPRILAIDDTPTNLLTLGAALEADFDLQIATSGAMGLAMATKAPPDLILLDVMMPEMDGYETCRRIMASPALRTIPVIFITALAGIETESTGLTLGAADYITKPINVEITRQRICNLLEREQLRKEVEQHRDHLEELVQARTLALSVAKEAAEAANRAKSCFLANMNHELRTPLTGMMGMSELALRRATDTRQKDQLTKAMLCSQRLLAIINDILDISRIEADRLTLDAVDFEVGRILEHLDHLMTRQAAEKGLLLSVEVAPELAGRTLHGDPLRLGQVLFHLTSNAIKFTSAGSVRVSVATTEETATDVLLHFEIRDTGIGISAADQAHLFTPFEQADASLARIYGGTGLGLALSKRLVQAMGGNIEVDSQVDVGSVFWFTVRLGRARHVVEAADPHSAPCAELELLARHAGARVLVVQDDPISREIAKDLMQDAGLRVDLAMNGAVAVEMARQTRYALILMDIQMPKMNGVDAALAILALPGREPPPILAMTASVSPEDKARCLEVGMQDIITQPLDPERLFTTMLRWLNQRST